MSSGMGRPRSMRIRLGKRYFRLETGKPWSGNAFGELDYEKKAIRLSPELQKQPKQLLNTLLHECLHAEFPFLDEDVVGAAADDLEAVLWRLGAGRGIQLPPRD